MRQTDEQTASHLLGKGYVVEDSRQELAATFSLENGGVRRNGTGIRFTEGGEPVDYTPFEGDLELLPSARLLIFKKAAVRRETSNSGLGGMLYALAEKSGRAAGYSGMALETVEEAEWLYDWYHGLGFKAIGSRRYSASAVDTILMIKPF
jgi:hypothetical protein